MPDPADGGSTRLMRNWWGLEPPLLTAGAAVGRLEVVGGAGLDGRHELRPFSASGLPGLNYSQKTNLNRTSGDLLGLG